MNKISKKTFYSVSGVLAFIIVGLGTWFGLKYAHESAANAFNEINKQYAELSARPDLAVATFSGGCFWCMEGPFEAVPGVVEVVSGYAGGQVERPTYAQVVSGHTGHRESVQVFYDPSKVTYDTLVTTYWTQVDPTDPGGQFADRGEQYTTAIFYTSDEEKHIAENEIKSLNASGDYSSPIATKVLPFTNFYPAEDYHQNFYKKSAAYYEDYKEGSGRAGYVKDKAQQSTSPQMNESSRYSTYTPESFAAAAHKKRVLFFHATWCPTCKVANADFIDNANQIPENVILFKTDYDTEKDLKKKYGITYQHTFVQVDAAGNEITKWNGGGIKKLLSVLK